MKIFTVLFAILSSPMSTAWQTFSDDPQASSKRKRAAAPPSPWGAPAPARSPERTIRGGEGNLMEFQI